MRGDKTKKREMESIYCYVGAKIRQIRLQQGLTLRSLEGLCGIHYGSISDIELAHHRASLAHIGKIAKALNVKIRELLPDKIADEEIQTNQELPAIGMGKAL